MMPNEGVFYYAFHYRLIEAFHTIFDPSKIQKWLMKKNVMNNFRYLDKFTNECNVSIMGEKTYLPSIQGGEFKGSEKPPYGRLQRNVYDLISRRVSQVSQFNICLPEIKYSTNE